MKRTVLLTLAIGSLIGGCAGEVIATSPGVTVVASTPDLVEVSPGVRVIADYDEPIFFVDGFYWWRYDGVWYRSSIYTGGWQYIASPPTVIIGLRPPMYRHYRPHGYVVRHRPVPSHRVQRPTVRDHRSSRDHRH
ncbi:MAG: hypothetical protein ABI867_16485 [Kofleriaceae bacterium]